LDMSKARQGRPPEAEVSWRGAGVFTRDDPPRLSKDGENYCGNPIDGKAYYILVSDKFVSQGHWLRRSEIPYGMKPAAYIAQLERDPNVSVSRKTEDYFERAVRVRKGKHRQPRVDESSEAIAVGKRRRADVVGSMPDPEDAYFDIEDVEQLRYGELPSQGKRKVYYQIWRDKIKVDQLKLERLFSPFSERSFVFQPDQGPLYKQMASELQITDNVARMFILGGGVYAGQGRKSRIPILNPNETARTDVPVTVHFPAKNSSAFFSWVRTPVPPMTKTPACLDKKDASYAAALADASKIFEGTTSKLYGSGLEGGVPDIFAKLEANAAYGRSGGTAEAKIQGIAKALAKQARWTNSVVDKIAAGDPASAQLIKDITKAVGQAKKKALILDLPTRGLKLRLYEPKRSFIPTFLPGAAASIPYGPAIAQLSGKYSINPLMGVIAQLQATGKVPSNYMEALVAKANELTGFRFTDELGMKTDSDVLFAKVEELAKNVLPPAELDKAWVVLTILSNQVKTQGGSSPVDPKVGRDFLVLAWVYDQLNGPMLAGPLRPLRQEERSLRVKPLLPQLLSAFRKLYKKAHVGGRPSSGVGKTTAYMTYNPVLFRLTQLYWPPKTGLTEFRGLLRHEDLLRKIDHMGTRGAMLAALQEIGTAATGNVTEVVSSALDEAYSPAIKAIEAYNQDPQALGPQLAQVLQAKKGRYLLPALTWPLGMPPTKLVQFWTAFIQQPLDMAGQFKPLAVKAARETRKLEKEGLPRRREGLKKGEGSRLIKRALSGEEVLEVSGGGTHGQRRAVKDLAQVLMDVTGEIFNAKSYAQHRQLLAEFQAANSLRSTGTYDAPTLQLLFTEDKKAKAYKPREALEFMPGLGEGLSTSFIRQEESFNRDKLAEIDAALASLTDPEKISS